MTINLPYSDEDEPIMDFDDIDQEQVNNFLSHFGIQHANSTNRTTACVVALPSAVDPIRLVGDEVKHATLLFLGETSSLPPNTKNDLLNTIAYASKSLEPFSASIMTVARLGDDDPPALVAKLSSEGLSRIRTLLQINPKIEDYLKNTPQFPQYTPHVTIGYPGFKEEAVLRPKAELLHRIKFDRLALWWNNEQIEFDLSSWGSGDEMAQYNDVDDFLAHFGVKGMKWGVRRSDAQLEKAASRRSSKPRTSDDEGFVSEDAKRAVSTLKKDSHEMSNREMKEAVDRARVVNDYKKMFNTSDLERKVQNLRLQKEYKSLNAELNPEKKSAIQKMVSASEKGFDAFQAVDGVLQGKLSAGLSKKVGEAIGIKEPGPSVVDKLTTRNKELDLTNRNLDLERKISAKTPILPQPKQKSYTELFAASAVTRAKADVKDAKDLNRILDDYLSGSKPGTVSPTGPNLPKKGTSAYGEMLIGNRPKRS